LASVFLWLLTMPELDQPDHEGLFLQAIEGKARIIVCNQNSTLS
jgi:hypothetical protein